VDPAAARLPPEDLARVGGHRLRRGSGERGVRVEVADLDDVVVDRLGAEPLGLGPHVQFVGAVVGLALVALIFMPGRAPAGQLAA
jgi:hypothetical protein